MHRYVSMVIGIIGLWVFTQTTYSIAHETKMQGLFETVKGNSGYHGRQRNLGFSNFLEDWLTPWETYEKDKIQAPRVPLLRITPAFFKREFRFDYIYVDDKDGGKADVSEWRFILELPLTLRTKIDIKPKLVYVDPAENSTSFGFGDTQLALRAMLLETNTMSFSTGSVINIPTGDKDRKLGRGVTSVGQQLSLWKDMGHRISLQAFLGVDVPTGGKRSEDPSVDFLYGAAFSKTFTIRENRILEGITAFKELNGQRGFGFDKGDRYVFDILPGVRWDLSQRLYVMKGIEIPLTGTERFDKRVWFSIIKDF